MNNEVATHSLSALNESAAVVTATSKRPSRTSVIWHALERAVTTVDAAPNREAHTLGVRSSARLWESAGLTATEAAAVERARFLAGIAPPMRTHVRSTADSVDQSLSVMTWCRYLPTDHDQRLKRCAIALARGENERVARIFAPHRADSRLRQIVYEARQIIAGRIQIGLRDHLGIVPGDGLSWARTAIAEAA